MSKPGQADVAHGRVERREQQVLREHSFARQPIEKRRFSGVRIADQRNHRPRRALAPVAVQAARALHLVELAADLGHPVADHPPVGLDLGFARTAKEAEAAALALEVGPAAHQAARLIIEMGELDLQPPFGGRRTLAEDLEDQPGAVDHLGADLLLQVLLLDRASAPHRRSAGPRLCSLASLGDLLDLPLAEQGRGPDRAHPERPCGDDLDADRFGEALGLLDARLGRTPRRLRAAVRARR